MSDRVKNYLYHYLESKGASKFEHLSDAERIEHEAHDAKSSISNIANMLLNKDDHAKFKAASLAYQAICLELEYLERVIESHPYEVMYPQDKE